LAITTNRVAVREASNPYFRSQRVAGVGVDESQRMDEPFIDVPHNSQNGNK